MVEYRIAIILSDFERLHVKQPRSPMLRRSREASGTLAVVRLLPPFENGIIVVVVQVLSRAADDALFFVASIGQEP